VRSAELLSFLQSPQGLWRATWIEDQLCRLVLKGFERGENIEKVLRLKSSSTVLDRFQDEWKAYWRGDSVDFHVPIRLQGTQFQLRVWQELKCIPHGQRISYRELALRVGNPRAYRAVGAANSKNPLPIVVPCHRVVQADGSLGGFAFGQNLKKFLLEHESKVVPNEGLEPPHLAAQGSKPCVSTNSTSWA
jgi:methylated-DNA-[protein]-cysteine S-methyltransferase